MLQEFNKVSTTSNLIKNLLISTYLPLIRTVRDFDYLLADRLYIYKCNIIKCTKSGYIVTGYQYVNFNGKRAEFRVLAEYYFGEQNEKLCTNYISNSEGYDSITHERLGKYLRSLRDMYDLNLMPLYNCFSNQILRGHYIKCTGDYSRDRVEKTSADYNTKIYKVPIRFNTDYTLCIENVGVTTIAPAFIKNNNLMKLNNNKFGNSVDVTNKYSKLYRTGVIRSFTGMRFREPVKIRFNNVPTTRTVKYSLYFDREIDALHDTSLYKAVTNSTVPRTKYYIKNEGYYFIAVEITQEEYYENVSKYYFNDNGIMTQCTPETDYKVGRVYYEKIEDKSGVTFLVTDLTPEDTDIQLYTGVEPLSGRSDASVDLEKEYLRYDPETDTLIQDMVATDKVTVTMRDKSMVVDVLKEKMYDSPNIEIISLWRRCTETEEFDPEETYYTLKSGIFYEWIYEFTEEEFLEAPSNYYIKNGDIYIRCRTAEDWDPNQTYYVSYLDGYVSTKEYYFIMNSSDFYVGKGFTEGVTYYKYEDNAFVQCSPNEEFDINKTYAIKKDREFYTWRVRDDQGNLVPTTDLFIREGVTYYSKDMLETEGEYIYDITEENCAMYDMIEDNLFMLVQVPKDYEQNIVILEGDYTHTESDKIIDDFQVDLLPRPMVDYLYTSNLKLMRMPTKTLIPFSDALIEFLLWNAINNLDSINNNMDRLTLAINKILDTYTFKYTNYWYPDFRKFVFDIGKNRNNVLVTDNLGYVNKNIEQVIFTTWNNEHYINNYDTYIEEERI